MPPEMEGMADAAGYAAETAYTAALESGMDPTAAANAAVDAAASIMTDMGAPTDMVDTMASSAQEGFSSAMDSGMNPMEAFEAAGDSVDTAMTSEYGPMDGPPTGMDAPTSMDGDMPPPGMDYNIDGAPPPGAESYENGPPPMEGDMPPPTDDMGGMPPPGMEGDMPPPTDDMASMDEASSYMDQSAAETPAPEYDPGAATNADIDTGDVSGIPDTTPDDDTSGMG